MQWLRDNWAHGQRLKAAWANQVARWFNRLAFTGPINEDRDNQTWTIFHSRPNGSAALVLADGGCGTVLADATEGAEAADTDTMSLGSAGNDQPFRLYAMTRAAYYHGGDKKFYGYVRALTFDAWGHLQSIGAETRVELDDAGPCT